MKRLAWWLLESALWFTFGWISAWLFIDWYLGHNPLEEH